jgi:hypothetical protein
MRDLSFAAISLHVGEMKLPFSAAAPGIDGGFEAGSQP